MKLSEFIRENPKVYIAGESGKWLVVVCADRAWRFYGYYEARDAANESCGHRICHGPAQHRLIELQVAPAAPARSLSKSWKRMVEST